MKIFSCGVFGFSLVACSMCFAQIDIFQSDAYSVEEMCAREAEQEAERGYTDYYEYCIEQNREKPMYQPRSSREELPESDENHGDEEYSAQ